MVGLGDLGSGDPEFDYLLISRLLPVVLTYMIDPVETNPTTNRPDPVSLDPIMDTPIAPKAQVSQPLNRQLFIHSFGSLLQIVRY